MTKEYRKIFEKIFHDTSSVSEMLLKFDLYSINYDANDKFHLAKYVYGLLSTFKHSKDLAQDWHDWLKTNIDLIATEDKVRIWVENDLLKKKNKSIQKGPKSMNSVLNSYLMRYWIEKHGIQNLTRPKKKQK